MAPRGNARRGARGGRADRDGDVSMKSSSGGVSKPNGVGRHQRLDKDGDVSMGASISTKTRPDRVGKSSNTASARGGINKRGGKPVKSRIDTSKIVAHIKDGKDSSTTLKEVSNESARSGLDELSVRGIENSKAATQTDGGLRQLLAFLERKSTKKIKKSRMEGNLVTISVRPDDTLSFTKINGFSFAGAELKIELEKPAHGVSKDGQQLKNKLMSMLDRRYNTADRLLDLSAIGRDPEFEGTGMFDVQRGGKFFLALMTVCDEAFTSTQQKREGVISVTLADNGLESLKDVASLAQTFPDLQNLDLSRNNLKRLTDLDAFRRKFRSLEKLYLHETPLQATDPEYRDQLKKWYPCLQVVDDIVVRTPEEAAIEKRKLTQLSFDILPARFDDESGLGEPFLRALIDGFDNDREGLVKTLYDNNSTFSISLNTTDAPAGAKFDSNDPWMKKSRNLLRINSPATRMNRRFRGTDAIAKAFQELPKTQHPNFDTDGQKWCVEAQMLQCLPDPTGASPTGVNGLMLVVHGEFAEGDEKSGAFKNTRSFDRVITLGPNPANPGSAVVINDMLTVRAYSGSDAWVPTSKYPTKEASSGMAVQLQVPSGYGEAEPGKPEEQLRKEFLEVELMKTTRLKLSYAQQCLQAVNYIPEEALKAYYAAKPNLAADAFF